jgi:hypothetical protein
MKKLFLALLVLTLGVDGALGRTLGLGFRVGPDMANETNTNPDSPNYTQNVLFGFTAGVFADVGLGSFLSLEPEADFAMKGVAANLNHIPVNAGSAGYADDNYTLNYNYLEIPLLLKAYTPLLPHLAGSLSVGPDFEIPLTTYLHQNITGAVENNSNQAMNDVGSDWGAMFGAGLELDGFLLDLRYDLGLTSVLKNVSNGPQNSVLSILMGYRIL